MADLRAVPVFHHEHCLLCTFTVSAMSRAAMQAGMQEHADYLNQCADQTTDPHFKDARMDALLRA